ncbi:efflux RND transporter periplasmic adaptor subunit [Elizabethkingia anophelis]|nr:efflux RND transporter periplasmic adaptor subunit [Elizabethkingia anophelis]
MNKIFLIILTAAVISSCSKEAPAEKKAVHTTENQVVLNDTQYKNAGIETGTLEGKETASGIMVTGSIDIPPQSVASVSAPFGGYIKYTKWMPGEHIAKGQVLASIENPELVQIQQDYLLAKSNLEYSQKDYLRQRDLNQSQASSDKVMQQALNQRNNHMINMRALGEKLRIAGINPEALTANNIKRVTSVVSPIDGYISSVNVNIGQYVSPADKLFEIVNTSDIHLVLKVFEKDLDKISMDQQVIAYTNQNPEKKYTARIVLISKDFAADRSVLIHCHFQNYEPHLLPGTFMNAEIETNSRASLAIPDSGVVAFEGKQYIFEEVKPKTYKMVPVKTGNSEHGFTEITGLTSEQASKKWVTKGAYNLLMALKNVEDEEE